MLHFSFMRESRTSMRVQMGDKVWSYESHKQTAYTTEQPHTVYEPVETVEVNEPPMMSAEEQVAMLPAPQVREEYEIDSVATIMGVIIAKVKHGDLTLSICFPGNCDRLLSSVTYNNHGFVYVASNRMPQVFNNRYRVLCEVPNENAVLLYHDESPFLLLAKKEALTAEGPIRVTNNVVYVPDDETHVDLYHFGKRQGYNVER